MLRKSKLSMAVYRETDDELTDAPINFLSCSSVHEAPFNTKIAVAVVVSPLENFLGHVQIECVR
jgi:hypothetical protein